MRLFCRLLTSLDVSRVAGEKVEVVGHQAQAREEGWVHVHGS